MAHAIPERILDFDPESREDVVFIDAAAIILVDVEKSAFLGAQKAMPFYEGASRARQKLVVFAQLSDEECHEIVAELDAKAAASVRPGREQLAELFKTKIR